MQKQSSASLRRQLSQSVEASTRLVGRAGTARLWEARRPAQGWLMGSATLQGTTTVRCWATAGCSMRRSAPANCRAPTAYPWRGDSALGDTAPDGVSSVSGGWYDAGGAHPSPAPAAGSAKGLAVAILSVKVLRWAASAAPASSSMQGPVHTPGLSPIKVWQGGGALVTDARGDSSSLQAALERGGSSSRGVGRRLLELVAVQAAVGVQILRTPVLGHEQLGGASKC